MQIKTLLVPYDFSEYAAHALTWAAELAKQCQAKLILFHAVPVFSRTVYPEGMFLLDLAKIEAEVLADAEKRLQEVAVAKSLTVAVETKVVIGDAVWEICQAAEREHADLIIMGSHGRTGLAHVVLGSVAERVVRHASCPVLVARKPQEAEKH
jgi:universal stress protein A